MQDYFYSLADQLESTLAGGEVLTGYYAGERSDFVRFNKSRLRQPGSVEQGSVFLRLIAGQRSIGASLPLSGNREVDFPRAERTLLTLRERIAFVPDDPYLIYCTDDSISERAPASRLPAATDVVDAVLAAAENRDLVGILAQGSIHRGFASSIGARKWFASHSFNLDFSYYLHDDKAVKTGYAGLAWDQAEFARKVEEANVRLAILERPAMTIDPGLYRVYLSPAAVVEILGMMSWGGFGKRVHATKQTAFLRMVEGETSLHPAFSLTENIKDGVDADFNADGFPRPERIELIKNGKIKDLLISPRSAREFKCEANGADSNEGPNSLDLAAGDLPRAEVTARLNEGVLVNNLWYLNFSDRNSFRLTGMTRFATFWVEGGQIKAPINVMRFDESVYRIFGEQLAALTKERDMILSSDTYSQRGTESLRVPGALVNEFRFTL